MGVANLQMISGSIYNVFFPYRVNELRDFLTERQFLRSSSVDPESYSLSMLTNESPSINSNSNNPPNAYRVSNGYVGES